MGLVKKEESMLYQQPPPLLKQKSHVQEDREEVLPFHTPSTGLHQLSSSSQPNRKNGDLRKKEAPTWIKNQNKKKNRKHLKYNKVKVKFNKNK